MYWNKDERKITGLNEHPHKSLLLRFFRPDLIEDFGFEILKLLVEIEFGI